MFPVAFIVMLPLALCHLLPGPARCEAETDQI
jgi:hypothetical protein